MQQQIVKNLAQRTAKGSINYIYRIHLNRWFPMWLISLDPAFRVSGADIWYRYPRTLHLFAQEISSGMHIQRLWLAPDIKANVCWMGSLEEGVDEWKQNVSSFGKAWFSEEDPGGRRQWPCVRSAQSMAWLKTEWEQHPAGADIFRE